MIQSKRVQYISAKTIAQLVDYSKKEWKLMRPLRHEFYNRTRALWTLYHNANPLCVIGIMEHTMIGSGAEVYFLLCEESKRCLKEFVRFIRRCFRRFVKLYGMLTVSIETSFPEGAAFVKFFGFKEVPHIFTAENINYKHYELRASWL